MTNKFILVSVLFLFLTGCSEPRPDGMPQIYPCKIKIVSKDNQPIADVSVNAMPVQQGSQWAGKGLTDSGGIAVMRTNGMYAGLPAGQFKIVVTKYNIVVRGESQEPLETLIFDKTFASEETTPLELEVKAVKNNEGTFTVW
ncbi:MAG: hypothetical protein FWE67_06660 [Planctomycetaceae bacterium]|nr:hypothetical protein [Planctomycetaceae bacterium]